jgi:hypothetical protein
MLTSGGDSPRRPEFGRQGGGDDLFSKNRPGSSAGAPGGEGVAACGTRLAVEVHKAHCRGAW